DHHVDAEMLPDVAEKIQKADGCDPGRVVEQFGFVGAGLKVKEATELFFHLGDVVLEGFGCEKLALGRPSAGVADESGGAAGECEGSMACLLEAAKGEQGDEI